MAPSSSLTSSDMSPTSPAGSLGQTHPTAPTGNNTQSEKKSGRKRLVIKTKIPVENKFDAVSHLPPNSGMGEYSSSSMQWHCLTFTDAPVGKKDREEARKTVAIGARDQIGPKQYPPASQHSHTLLSNWRLHHTVNKDTPTARKKQPNYRNPGLAQGTLVEQSPSKESMKEEPLLDAIKHLKNDPRRQTMPKTFSPNLPVFKEPAFTQAAGSQPETPAQKIERLRKQKRDSLYQFHATNTREPTYRAPSPRLLRLRSKMPPPASQIDPVICGKPITQRLLGT